MWDIPRLYASACSNSVQLVPLHPIIMAILFQHYKELKECILEVERIKAGASDSNNDELTKKEEGVPTTVTLDGYFIHNNANFK